MNTDHMIIEAVTPSSASGRRIQGAQTFVAHNRDGVHAYGTPSELMELFPHAHVEGSASSAASVVHRVDDRTGLCSAPKCWKHNHTETASKGTHWNRRR